MMEKMNKEYTIVLFLFLDITLHSLVQYFSNDSFESTSDTLTLWFCSVSRSLMTLICCSILNRSSTYTHTSDVVFRTLQIVYTFNWIFLAIKLMFTIQDRIWNPYLISMFVLNFIFSFGNLYMFFQNLNKLKESKIYSSMDIPLNTPVTAVLKNENQKLTALDGLRAIAAFHIVLYHISPETSGIWGNIISWGGSQLTTFFCLSGFVLAFSYGKREEFGFRQFIVKRMVKLYPTLWLSILLVLPILSFGDDYQLPQLLSVIFSTTAWDQNFQNRINEPAWFVGAIVLNYFLFPSLLKLMKDSKNQTRFYCLLPLCYLFSAWAALVLMGNGFTIWYHFNQVIFKAHVPEFVFGMALGLNYLQKEESFESEKFTVLKYFGTTFSFWTFIVIISTVRFESEYMEVWGSNGLFLPILGYMIWSLSNDVDVFGQIFKFPVIVELGKVSYCVYILQACVKTYMFKYFIDSKFDVMPYSQFPMFFALLISSSFIAFYGFSYPISKLANKRVMKLHDPIPVPPRDFFSKNVWISLQLIGYIVLFCGIVSIFTYVCLSNKLGLIEIEKDTRFANTISILKWVIAVGLPSLLMNVCGQIFWPAPLRRKYPTLESLCKRDPSDVETDDSFHGCLHIRIVTRGKNPNLVLDNAENAVKVLRESGLPEHRWVVEIVTDNALFISERSNEPIIEILVPEDYVCPNGGKYKARALHYAIAAGKTKSEDWIIHLDEETRFNCRTVTAIYAHCKNEHQLIKQGKQKYPKIGQGVILYGAHENIDNYVTTLADSVRVGDDFGKFRLQYQFNRPWIGMHGSFVVANHVVEETFGFDHGIAGSITEDAHFALHAWSDGVHMAWIDAFMFEQSPFTVLDFIRQRARWFGGLYLVCRDPMIPFRYRAILSFTTLSWAFSPFICLGMFLSLLFRTEISTGFRIALSISSSLSCFGYVLGYFLTFDMKHGLIRYLILLYLVLIGQPLFALLEIAGILYTFYQPPSKGFFVVQKEQGKPNLSNCDKKAITKESVLRKINPKILLTTLDISE